MEHTLEPLPYSYDALAPVISERTLRIHHDKHHGGYVRKLNELTQGTRFAHTDLTSLVVLAESSARNPAVYRNAAQAWNHGFYWHSLAPSPANAPGGALGALVAQRFGSLAGFREEFTRRASEHFGSGWAWLLVTTGGELGIATTHDADNPLASGGYPLLCCDLWEHAYYLDFQNERTQYIKAVAERLLNWEFAVTRLEAASARHVA